MIKLSIGQKETAETQFWLELLYETDYIFETEFKSLYSDTKDVMNLIRSSILTKKRNAGLKAITILVIISSILWSFI